MKNSFKQETAFSIGIIIVSVLVLVCVAVVCLRPKQPEEELPAKAVMPDIVGYSCGEAKIYYRELFSIEVSGEEFSDIYLEGAILSQSIPSGTEYDTGNTVVSVTVSKGAKPEETTVTEPPVTEITTTAAETEPEPPPLTDGKIDNPPAEFESAYPDFDLDITVHGFEIPEGRGKEIEKELYNLMRKHGADAGLLYYDPATGGSIEYNADEKFSSGSIIKAIYARSLLGAGIDLTEEKYEMTEEMLNGPYEYVNGQPLGTEFTAEELIRAALAKSDNTAYKMLYNYIGYSYFNDYAASLRLPQRMTDDNYWFRLSARHTASYFKDIYFFTEQHVNGEFMKECLANAEYREMVSAALPDKTVAEKYGYLPQEDFYTLGDGAIVYGDRPYVIVIYVRGTGNDLNTKFFRDAAVLVDELHELFGEQ